MMKSLDTAGFSLLEVAVTLLIVTLLLGSIFIPLQTQVESRKLEETQRLLDQAREGLLGYAAAYGYFPCPADGLSGGIEPPAGTPPVDHATGVCPSYWGFLPGAILGFTRVDDQGYALDAWGAQPANRIRYAVSNQIVGGVTVPFTRSGGMSAAGVPVLGAANNLLYICGSGTAVPTGVDCGVTQTLASNAVAVIWSSGTNATTGGASIHERENPNPNGGSEDPVFVSRVRSNVSGAEFDDQLTWIPGFIVVNRLISTGQLP